MIKSLVNKLLMILYFVVGALILEFIAFKVLHFGVVPEYFLLDLSIILILGLIVFCIPNFTAQYIVYTILLLIQVVLIYINYTLYTIYGDLFSFDMLNLVREAAAAITTNFVYFKIIFQLIAVFLSISIVGFVMLKVCKKAKIKIKQHFSIFNIILLLSIQFLSIGYYTHMRSYINVMGDLTDANYTESDAFLMNTSFLKSTSYTKFGSYGYMLNLIFNSFGSINEAHKKATLNYFKNGNIYNEIDEMGNKREMFGVDKYEGANGTERNNVIVLMMESMEWLAFSNGNIKTEENGVSQYDRERVLNNLSYELTPNIYSIIYGDDYLTDTNNSNTQNDATIFKNFFAKSKTNISEGYGFIGHYPVGEALNSFAGDGYDKSLNAFGYTLPNMLKAQGYQTTFVHSNLGKFYSRSETHGNLGFDKVVFKDSLVDENGNQIYKGANLEWNNWAPEAEFARNALNYIVPETENPFFTFYLNVSSHGAYTPEDNLNDGDALRYYDYVKYGKDNCQLLEDKKSAYNNYVWKRKSDWDDIESEQEKYSEFYYNILKNYGTYNANTDKFEENSITEQLVYYECGAMGLDEAIGVIINELKEKNIYDKTTLVLYSDHYCYYGSLSNHVKGFNQDDTLSIELNSIPMIMSSPGLKQLAKTTGKDYNINDRFCSAYDIIPTLLDLLGIPFNENYYLGHSVFRPADYVYAIDSQTGLAQEVLTGQPGKDLVVYYSNTGGMFSEDCYTLDLKTFYNRTGKVLSDTYLINLFKSEATNQLIKLNYLHILNRYHLYDQINIKAP